jgi:hypothetical protein
VIGKKGANTYFCPDNTHVHWQSLYAKMTATAAPDCHNCTCLCHLGWHDTDRNISICAASPKVAKARTIVTVACCSRWCFYHKNFANGKMTLSATTKGDQNRSNNGYDLNLTLLRHLSPTWVFKLPPFVTQCGQDKIAASLVI